jgi:hypothetical protein
VVEVLPLSPHLLMRSRHEIHRLPPAMASPLAPGHSALRRLERTLGFAIPARMEDARPIRQGSERLDPQVYLRLLSRWRQ